jgi:dTDP-4-amino-4,6-dideoxygalactose transaminase
LDRIYLSPPDVSKVERDLLLEAFDSNWIAPVGPQIDAFEREVAEYVGVAGAAALSSGTAALHLSLLALDVTADDDVIVPTLTFAATPTPSSMPAAVRSSSTVIGQRGISTRCSSRRS